MITPYLYVPLIAWAIAQLLKFTIALIRGEADLRYLYASGGMPSVHSAVVCSLAAYALFNAGADSPIFGVTAILAAIVMYDSFGVRRAAGEQARAINQIVDELGKSGAVRGADDSVKVREILGHKPHEVMAGAVLGVVTAAVFSINSLSPKLQAAWTLAGTMELRLLMGVIVLAVLVVIVCSIVVMRGFAKSARGTAYRWLGLLVLVALFGGFIIFSIRQQVAYFSTSAAAWLAVVVILCAIFGVIYRLMRLQKKSKNTQVENPRKDAWLKKAGKKK